MSMRSSVPVAVLFVICAMTSCILLSGGSVATALGLYLGIVSGGLLSSLFANVRDSR